jgi:NAD(P)-dependent dehydrogenase (short-subunit alcohol dehydrogenase family)
MKPSRSVLITGASGGIGRALCTAFATAGWQVLATDTAAALAAAPLDASATVPADLAALSDDPSAQVEFGRAVRAATADIPLAALVNNAAVQRVNPTAAVTVADWSASLAVNLRAPFHLVQLFLPELTAARGSVVNVGSIHARQTKPGFVVYATTKAALDGLTRALAVDLGPLGVRVNAIAPAAISTPMLEAGFKSLAPTTRQQLDAFHPVGRVGTPAEVAALAVWLAGDSPAFLTGACVSLDGGISGRLHDPA